MESNRPAIKRRRGRPRKFDDYEHESIYKFYTKEEIDMIRTEIAEKAFKAFFKEDLGLKKGAKR